MSMTHFIVFSLQHLQETVFVDLIQIHSTSFSMHLLVISKVLVNQKQTHALHDFATSDGPALLV